MGEISSTPVGRPAGAGEEKWLPIRGSRPRPAGDEMEGKSSVAAERGGREFCIFTPAGFRAEYKEDI